MCPKLYVYKKPLSDITSTGKLHQLRTRPFASLSRSQKSLRAQKGLLETQEDESVKPLGYDLSNISLAPREPSTQPTIQPKLITHSSEEQSDQESVLWSARNVEAGSAIVQKKPSLSETISSEPSLAQTIQRMKVGKFTFEDNEYHRSIKPAIIKAIGGKQGIQDLLKNKNTNCDFYIKSDGTILIGENGTRGKDGADTGLNYFTLFNEKSETIEVPPQNRNFGLPPSDSEEDD